MPDPVARTTRRHRSARGRILSAMFVLTLGTIFVLVSRQDADGQLYSETTTVLAVEIPVNVVGKDGKAVRGLTQENFEVFEGRQKHQIVDFEVVDLASFGTDPGGEIVETLQIHPQARRRFLLLFDLSFSNPAGVLRAREAARDLVVSSLHPSDLAAVATYTEAEGAKLVLGFTPDRYQLAMALASLGFLDPTQRLNDPLQVALQAIDRQFIEPAPAGRNPQLPPTQMAYFAELRNWDGFFVDHLRDQSAATIRRDRDTVKNQMLAMTSAYTQLAQMMASVEGRKQVVLFTEGWDSSVAMGIESADRQVEVNEAAALGEFWRVDSDERFGSGSSQEALLMMLDEFRRSDCTIQAVDVGGMRGAASATDMEANRGAGIGIQTRARGEDGMFVMARETGGELFRNYNDLSEAMGSVLDHTSVTYVLVLQPQQVELDGSFHEIEVRLKKAPKGARVMHKPGYFASRAYASLTPEARRMSTADLLTTGEEGGRVSASVLAAPFKSADGGAYVLTMIEMMGYNLIEGREMPQIPVELYIYAFDTNGLVRDFVSQAIVLDRAKVGQQLMATGFKFVGHLDLEPGDYTLRVAVRHGISGAAGVKTVEVSVPDYSADDLSLAPPFFIEPDGSWVLGWEDEADEAVAYPLNLREKRLVPASQPILAARSETPVLLVAHNLSSGALRSAAVVASNGKPVAQASLAIRDRFETEVPGVDRLWASVDPGNVPPGAYDLIVTLRDETTGREAQSQIPIFVQ